MGHEVRPGEGGAPGAAAVVAAVALSGVFLVVFVPELWWVFTTYFWIAFPALGRLSRGVAGGAVSEAKPVRSPEISAERELLAALKSHGELSAARAAVETSLSVAEADRRLGELASDGHLEVRVREGAILYAMWEARPETGRAAELASRPEVRS